MSDPSAVRTAGARMLVVGALLGALVACSDTPTEPDGPSPTGSTSSAPTTDTPTAEPTTDGAEVRATLGALDPCVLLADGADALYAEGPHTCEAQLDDVRVRVAVGVPFDDAAREAAEQLDLAGLTAYDEPDLCRVVFPAGATHGIAVEADSDCAGAAEAGAVVGAALAADVDPGLRTPGPDSHTACALVADAVDDPALLVDAVGTTQGLDHCELADGPVLARTSLSLGYTRVPFGETLRLLEADLVSVSGQDAGLVAREDGGCFLHVYLWPTRAEGRGEVSTEATVSAATCREARTVGAAVVAAAGTTPVQPASVTALLTPAG